MPGTGFIDHIGVGVPDLAAAKRYYDELMPILGLRAWIPTTEAGDFNYGPDGARGSQIFFYPIRTLHARGRLPQRRAGITASPTAHAGPAGVSERSGLAPESGPRS